MISCDSQLPRWLGGCGRSWPWHFISIPEWTRINQQRFSVYSVIWAWILSACAGFLFRKNNVSYLHSDLHLPFIRTFSFFISIPPFHVFLSYRFQFSAFSSSFSLSFFSLHLFQNMPWRRTKLNLSTRITVFLCRVPRASRRLLAQVHTIIIIIKSVILNKHELQINIRLGWMKIWITLLSVSRHWLHLCWERWTVWFKATNRDWFCLKEHCAPLYTSRSKRLSEATTQLLSDNVTK